MDGAAKKEKGDLMAYKVIVKTLVGDRRLSDLMANAGLGITGAGVNEFLNIAFKEGEIVDEDRVNKMMKSMIKESEKLKTSFKIISYEIISIERS